MTVSPETRGYIDLTFRTLFARSMMVFEECSSLETAGTVVLSHPHQSTTLGSAPCHHTDGEPHEPALSGYSRGGTVLHAATASPLGLILASLEV